MYIRVKRKKTTIFLHVEPTDTVLEVKQKLQDLVEQVCAGSGPVLKDANLSSIILKAQLWHPVVQCFMVSSTSVHCFLAATRKAAAFQGHTTFGGCKEAR